MFLFFQTKPKEKKTNAESMIFYAQISLGEKK